jgi:hypothetical protein
MIFPIPPELEFDWQRQERLREAEANRLADLARQYARARRRQAGDTSRKELDR